MEGREGAGKVQEGRPGLCPGPAGAVGPRPRFYRRTSVPLTLSVYTQALSGPRCLESSGVKRPVRWVRKAGSRKKGGQAPLLPSHRVRRPFRCQSLWPSPPPARKPIYAASWSFASPKQQRSPGTASYPYQCVLHGPHRRYVCQLCPQ